MVDRKGDGKQKVTFYHHVTLHTAMFTLKLRNKIVNYFASSVSAMRPEAIVAAADVPPKLSTHPDCLSAVICMNGKIGKREKEINSAQLFFIYNPFN